MNRILLLLIIGFAFITCSNTFPPEDSDLARKELKGPVKFVEATKYWAKRRAKPFDLDNLRLEDDFRNKSTYLWHFNEDGHSTSSSTFDKDQLKSETIDSFDQRGNPIQRLIYEYSRGKVLDGAWLYTYDEHDNLLEVSILDIDSFLVNKQVYSYNHLQKKSKTVYFRGKQQKEMRTTTYQYDGKGRVIEKLINQLYSSPTKVIYEYEGINYTKTVFEKDSIMLRKEKYVYRQTNQLKERNVENYSNDVKRTVWFNKEGWVEDIKSWTLTNNGEQLKHIKYVYKYDSKGNWIRRATYINNELDTIEFRKIDYY